MKIQRNSTLSRKALEEEFEPHSMMRRQLVERLAGIMWRIRRIPKFEAAIIEFYCDRMRSYSHSADARRGLEGPGGAAGEAFIADGKYSNALGKLSRHEAALMNALTKHCKCCISCRASGQWMIQLWMPLFGR
jgi:hypothetical protein